jgi:mycothiol synthase
MNTATQPIRPIDLRNACEDDYARLSALNDRLRAERLPDDPPVPLEESIEEWRNIPAFVGVSAWVIEEAAGGQAVARGTAYVLRTGENEHLAQFEIGVLPEFRRQGLARRLLAPIAEFARQEGRRLLLTSSNGRVPAGEAFMRRLGAEPGQEGHTNQLDLADLDRDLLARWLREGPERAASFELGLWDAEYPEADLPAITELYAILNGAPRDNLDLEDQHYTP